MTTFAKKIHQKNMLSIGGPFFPFHALRACVEMESPPIFHVENSVEKSWKITL